MTLSPVTFLMQLNFLLTSQVPLHDEAMTAENCQGSLRDFVPEFTVNSVLFLHGAALHLAHF